MKLQTALKQKNFLIKEIKKLQGRISEHNSIIKGNRRQYSISELLENMHAKTDKLIELKTAITKANSTIQADIYRISELKSLINFYNSIPSKEGSVMSHYGDNVLEYESEMSKFEIDTNLDLFEVELRELMLKIEIFNIENEI